MKTVTIAKPYKKDINNDIKFIQIVATEIV